MEQQILQSLNNIYPINISKVERVTGEMYRCIADQGIYFARITNYKSYDEQLEEIKWTSYLFQKGVGVSQVITSINNRLIDQITLNQVLNTVVFKASPGQHLSKRQWNAKVFKDLGRQIGKMHRLTKIYEKQEIITYIYDWHKSYEYAFLKYIPMEQTMIREIAEEVVTSIRNLPINDLTYGIIHGDIWLENVLVDHHNNISIIDFQDCEKHFYIYDLAVPIYSAMEYSFVGSGNISDYGRSITKAIIEGYQVENDLDQDMLGKLPLFIKLKEIFEYSLMYMYWDQDELTEEQVRIMNHFRLRIEQKHAFLLT